MSATVSDDVQRISFHSYRSLISHFYVGPFIFLYSLWAAMATQSEHSIEVKLIALATCVILHILCGLFCVWSVEWKTLCMCSTLPDVVHASLAKVVPTKNNGSTKLCAINRTKKQNEEEEFWIDFQQTKYNCLDGKSFKPISFPVDFPIQDYIGSKGLGTNEVLEAEMTWGGNVMKVILPTFRELFVERATAPFFVFQVFCVALWCLDEYWYYSLFTLGMLAMFEATVVKQQMKSMSEIKKMTQEPYLLNVYRNKRWEKVKSHQLYPGDLISLTRRTDTVPCDLLLLHGQCVVDESMLTGESVPLMKESIAAEDGSCGYAGSLDLDTHSRLHVVFGGTKVIQHTAAANKNFLKSSDSGCIAYVLRNGFNTAQGKLLRTIMYSVQRVTANNFEAFMFILFLLQFAIAASAYVWIEGTKDPDRNRYKLFLECTLILTSVVPPELPIELSLAVNSSLLSLIKMGIYCTEPFRIPFAGKVHICCFDKTGTLTSDKLELTGVCGISDNPDLVDIKDVPISTSHVLATCHSLLYVDDKLIGDPIERATLSVLPWTLTKGDVVICKTVKQSLKILKRFHFNSALKRMSVLVSKQDAAFNTELLVMTKGAPEVIKDMLKEVPANYDATHKRYTLQGGRVIALARRSLDKDVTLRDVSREEAERELTFCGFVVFATPLKKESKAAVAMLKESSHYVVMITGDSPLTACYVANQLKISKKILILTEHDDSWRWETPDGSVTFPIGEEDTAYSLCLTGQGMVYCLSTHDKTRGTLFEKIITRVQVFARVTPKQKEEVITTLKSQGLVTVMCGDGTNDVGALKHAEVGVAIISNAPEVKPEKKETMERLSMKQTLLKQIEQSRRDRKGQMADRQKMLEEKLQELQAEEDTLVKLGDASIASPFTSKYSSVKCVCNIIRQTVPQFMSPDKDLEQCIVVKPCQFVIIIQQTISKWILEGRCTLVTTLQMFKILALNALIIAYCQSALYLDGVKFSDGQATLQGLLLAGCFLFISRSAPLDKLSKARPHANIFNLYTISTVLLQFAVHLYTIVRLVAKCHAVEPRKASTDLEADFAPSLLNSIVYIVSVTLQLNTFIINYRGHPYMEALRENKPLCYSAVFTASFMLILTFGVAPEINTGFSLMVLPEGIQNEVFTALLLDSALTFAIDRILLRLCGDAKLKRLY